jgi:hypothetical protein
MNLVELVITMYEIFPLDIKQPIINQMINIFVDETCELTNDVFIYTCSVVIQTFIILVAPNNYHTSFEIDRKTAVITQIKDVTTTDILTIMVINVQCLLI